MGKISRIHKKKTGLYLFKNLKIMTKVIIASVTIMASVTNGECHLWQVLLMAKVLWQV